MKKFLIYVILMMPLMSFAETVTIDGINYNLITKGFIAEVAENSMNSKNKIIIPEKVTYNGVDYTVVTIVENAFGSSNMTYVEIPNTVTSIGWQAFHTCKQLKDVKIGSGVSSIGGSIFSNCYNLSSIIISSDNIYYDSRNNCNAVIETSTNRLLFASNNTKIPNTVTEICSEAFENLNSISVLDIPNSVISIGRWGVARCENLKAVNIGDGIKTIGQQAFEYDSSLKTVSIGKGINKIEWGAFGNCTNIEDIYIYSDYIPQTNTGAFNESHIEYSTLHVPSSLIEQYKKTDPWKNFKDIVSIENNDNVTKKCGKPTINYKDGKLEFYSTTEGADFVTDIKNSDIRKYYDAIISLNVTYDVSVFATKSGYEDSDIATATLCWIDETPKTEGISNGVANIRSKSFMIQNREGQLTINGIDDGIQISVFSLNGSKIDSVISRNGTAVVNTNLRIGSMAIVKIGENSFKFVLK